MWPKEYEDYQEDDPLKKERLETGKGIVGVEMNDSFGWGESFHTKPKPKKGLLARLFGGKNGR
jgi:hypothetical protein